MLRHKEFLEYTASCSPTPVTMAEDKAKWTRPPPFQVSTTKLVIAALLSPIVAIILGVYGLIGAFFTMLISNLR